MRFIRSNAISPLDDAMLWLTIAHTCVPGAIKRCARVYMQGSDKISELGTDARLRLPYPAALTEVLFI